MISSGRTVLGLSLAIGVTLAACSSANLDESASDTDVGSRSAEVVGGRLDSVRVFRLPGFTGSISALDSQNALPSGALAEPSLRDNLRAVGSTKLQFGTPGVEALRTTPRGGTLLKYLARCALREGDLSLSPAFPGRLGLAPNWATHLLSPEEKRWITACLMAHTNNVAQVGIAVSGEFPEPRSTGYLSPEPDEYRVEEAAFFGDIFTAQSLFACSGAGTQALCADRGVSADLQRRICGTASAAACGFTYVGECNKLNGGTLVANVCTAEMPYVDCRGTGAARYREIITVSVRTDVEALRLHPRCTKSVAPSCSHSRCALGAPLAPSCSGGVCATDSYCCTVAWDSNCAAAAGCAP